MTTSWAACSRCRRLHKSWDPTLGYPGEGPGQDELDFDEAVDLEQEELDRAVGDLELVYDACSDIPLDGQLDEQIDSVVGGCGGPVHLTDELLQRAGLDVSSGADVEPTDDAQGEFALTVECFNVGSWASAKARISSAGAEVHAFLFQEVRLSATQVHEADRWLAARGWQAVWSPAERLASGRLSGGVAVVARATLGLALPTMDANAKAELYPAHLVVGMLGLPGGRDICIASVYAFDSEGESPRNAAILETLAAFSADCGRPMLAGGDFNMLASEVGHFYEERGIDLAPMASFAEVPTCVARGAEHRAIDFFVASSVSSTMFQPPVVQADAVAYPHRPVRVSAHSEGHRLETLQWVRPPALPRMPVVGPRKRVRDPLQSWRAAMAALEAASCGSCCSSVRRSLSTAYFEWALLAEEEVAAATDTVLHGKSRRARVPKRKVMPIVPPRTQAQAEERRALDRVWMAQQAAIICDLLEQDSSAECVRDACSLVLGRGRAIARTLVEALPQSPGEDLEVHAGFACGWCAWLSTTCDHAELLAGWRETSMESFFCGGAAHLRRVRDQSWRSWAQGAVARGARGGHRFTTTPQTRTLLPVLGADGRPTASSAAVVESYGKHFEGLWQASPARQPHRHVPSDARQPSRLTAAELRQASRGYAMGTAIGPDGFAMQHFGMLSDGCLETLALIFEAVELSGVIPRQWDVLSMTLIPKASGGHRTIGIFVGAVRLWAKARRALCNAWEAANARAYWGAAAGKQALDPVWRWAVQAEVQRTSEEVCATFIDVSAFYESLDHEVLLDEARATGFPVFLLRAALALYGAARYVRCGPFLAEPRFASRGVVAGCSLATTLVKVYLLRRLDIFTLRHPLSCPTSSSMTSACMPGRVLPKQSRLSLRPHWKWRTCSTVSGASWPARRHRSWRQPVPLPRNFGAFWG